MKYWLSILIPSIRPEGLLKFLDSLRLHSLSFNNIQFVILRDGDKEDVKYEENLVYITRPKEKVLSVAKLQYECYKYALADWIMLGNDDVICETFGWDGIVQEAMRTHDDNITLIWPNDNMLKEKLSCFPIFHRKMFDLIYPLRYRRYKVDDTIFNVFPDTRKIYLSNISFKHENDHGQIGYPLGDGRIYPVEPTAAIHDEKIWNEEVVTRYNIRKKVCSDLGAVFETKVLIGISTQEMARRADFYDNVDLLTKIPGTIQFKAHGQSPARARNLIIREAFEQNCTHVLFLDDDISFKNDTLINLLKHNKDIICGLQLMRAYPHKPILFDFFDENEHAHWRLLEENESGLIPCVATGLGAVLVKLWVFEKMKQPWIRLGELEADNWCDDIGFWGRLSKEVPEAKMFCDLDTPIGHHVNITIWPNKISGIWHTTYDSQGPGLAHIPQLKPEKKDDSNRTNKEPEPAIA